MMQNPGHEACASSRYYDAVFIKISAYWSAHQGGIICPSAANFAGPALFAEKALSGWFGATRVKDLGRGQRAKSPTVASVTNNQSDSFEPGNPPSGVALTLAATSPA
jgi:hypothetical protein